MIDVDTGAVARKYIELGFWSLLLAFIATVLLAVSGGFFYSSFVATGFNGVTLAFAIGAVIGLAVTVLVAVIIVLALRALWEHFQHRQYIERLQADALLREPQPAPWVVDGRPIVANREVAPVKPSTIGDIPEEAFSYFVAQLCRGVSHAQRKWEGLELPGGYSIGSFESYDRLVRPLVELGIIVGRTGQEGGNKPGMLTTHDREHIMSRLREWDARRKLAPR